ncbi:MAG TPA: glycosyltransferase family 39 protein, partial [Acidimicrobiales bacterium]|nr:glycosyltransferase family 39 protein [Acidimicrobiales bacterium]
MSIGTVADPPWADSEEREGGADNDVQTGARRRGPLLLVRTVLVLAVALGLALRLWDLFHFPLNADEASVGLAAQSIAHGHFIAFFPGQFYGGAEPYVTAVFVGIFGPSARAVKLAPAVLSVVAALLTWRVVLRLVADRQVAALAGALMWVAPLAVIWNSTVERGFRGVTMACGLACLLFALRCLDGRHGYADLAALGLFLGIGWWSSPEIAYFVVPTGLVLIGAVAVSPAGRRIVTWVPRLAVGLAGVAVGALPWLWVNIPG